MTFKLFLTILFTYLIQSVDARPLRKLIKESKYIVIGTVTTTLIKDENLYRVTIQVDSSLKGDIHDTFTLDFFHCGGLHSLPCSHFDFGKKLLLFLQSNGTTYSLNTDFGLINLNGQTNSYYTSLINDFLKITNATDRKEKTKNWLLQTIKTNIEFSYLCSDLYEFRKILTHQQQLDLLKIFFESDTLFSSQYYQTTNPYLVLDYFQIASILGKEFKNETIPFLVLKLQTNKSAYLTRSIMREIYFVKKDNELKLLLTEFDKKQVNNNSDIIDKNSKSIIDQFIKVANDR